MTTLYWILEYSKVLFAYVFIMFIWPNVVFRKYLKGKTPFVNFAFCSTVQIVIVNTLVLMLGLFHLLNPWVFRIVFYGWFLYSIFKDVKLEKRQKKKVKWLLTGTYGVRSFLSDIWRIVAGFIRKGWNAFLRIMHSKWGHYALLAVVIIYGMIYFTYGAFQDYSYGFGDMYPHNAWIYGLTNGQIFSAGVYPEGMHCFIYAMHTLFGIRIYSCLLFTAGIHIAVFLLSAYILFRQIFRWKYTPLLALTLFLTVDVLCINEIYSMSRLQWTIPQEFGLYTQFLCAAFLARYLYSKKKEPKIEEVEEVTDVSQEQEEVKVSKIRRFITRCKKTKLWRAIRKTGEDENVLIFMMSLAASLVIHFYPTIMAFFLCVAFIPVTLNKIFTKERFWNLVTAAIVGVIIAVIPMAGALASGIGFQGSIGWAVHVMNGTDNENGTTEEETTSEEETTGALEQSTGNEAATETTGSEENTGDVQANAARTVAEPVSENAVTETTTVAETTAAVETEVEEAKPPLSERLKYAITHLDEILKEKADIVYHQSYITLYRHERANHILVFTFLAMVIWAVYRIISMILKMIFRKLTINTAYFDGYLSLALASILFMALYCASALGFPALIAGSRLCSVAQLYITAVCVVPLDILFSTIARVVRESIMRVFAVIAIAVIYIIIVASGNFHGFLYYELTRHNGAVMSTYTITEKLPQNSFTIVSAVDELYQVIQYGYHEELVNFVNEATEDSYKIPTEYVFLFVEKNSIEYAQSHFFTGPEWLAEEKYADFYNSYVSQCPDITTHPLIETVMDIPYSKMPLDSRVYSNLSTRTILESRLYAWCREFNEMYPNELHTYYEDENFVCYYFKQNPFSLYELAIQ